MNLMILLEGKKIIGGPVDALADFTVDIVPGVYAIDHKLTEIEGALDAKISVLTDEEDDLDTLPSLPQGYRLIEQRVTQIPTFRLGCNCVEATVEFTWRLHEGVYVPAHWLQRDAATCIAMHRMLGPDETKWPEVADGHR